MYYCYFRLDICFVLILHLLMVNVLSSKCWKLNAIFEAYGFFSFRKQSLTARYRSNLLSKQLLINSLFIHDLSLTQLIYKAIQFLKSECVSYYHIDVIHGV